MLVNIERAIKSITEKIGFFQPLHEGIINSFQANADKLDIDFETDVNNKIIGYSVNDNGDGFTDENIESFLELWSNYKIDIGGLGSGRIMCLKVFDDIVFKSQRKDNKKIEFVFNKNFNANSIDDLDKCENLSEISGTKTDFKKLNDLYSEDEDTFLDVDNIKEKTFIALLPMFIKFEKENKDFRIFINDNIWLNKENLAQKITEYNFQDNEFSLNSGDGTKETFTLTYRIKEDQKNTLEQFYGANDRFIRKFTSASIEKLDDGFSAIFCLTSPYFESRVSDSRNTFKIAPNQNLASIENPITFPAINKELERVLNEILKKEFPDIENKFNALKKELSDEFPHLGRYLNETNNLTASKINLKKDAERLFLKRTKDAKDKVDTFTSKLQENINNFDEEKYKKIKDEFTVAGADKLVEYIAYRQTIIKMLQAVDRENQESDIHDLFMKRSTRSNDFREYQNNIWIFDDKFMSFNYAASDVTIKEIINYVSAESVVGTDSAEKPDLIMFYSDDEDKPKNVLIIEFKKIGLGKDGKMNAVNRIKNYPMIIRKYVKNIGSIFAYSIIDIDDKFREKLTEVEGFKENSFGDSENNVCAYYSYNKTVRAHLNIVSFSQTLQNANKRNSVFLSVLKDAHE